MANIVQADRTEFLTRDSEFQRLSQEHSRYEAELDQLSSSPYLSSEALLLEAKLKKMKLRVKDEMQKRAALLSQANQVH